MQNFQEHSDRQINGLKWVVQEIWGTVILPGAVWNAGRQRRQHAGHEAGNSWTWIFMWIDVAMRPETNSSYWKMDGWKTILSFWVLANFQGQIVSFSENNPHSWYASSFCPSCLVVTRHRERNASERSWCDWRIASDLRHLPMVVSGTWDFCTAADVRIPQRVDSKTHPLLISLMLKGGTREIWCSFQKRNCQNH